MAEVHPGTDAMTSFANSSIEMVSDPARLKVPEVSEVAANTRPCTTSLTWMKVCSRAPVPCSVIGSELMARDMKNGMTELLFIPIP